jgi:hypothetical protein
MSALPKHALAHATHRDHEAEYRARREKELRNLGANLFRIEQIITEELEAMRRRAQPLGNFMTSEELARLILAKGI